MINTQSTKNGFKFEIKDGICILQKPRYICRFSKEIREAKKEIYENEKIPYFKEIILKENDFLNIEI